MERHIQLPITRETARTIKSGESCLLSGVIYTARDAAHKRLCELLEAGKPLPFDVKDATIYYVGPTPAKPGQVIGSAGPTTSYRMDAYSPMMIAAGETGRDRRRGGASFQLHQKSRDRLLRRSRRGSGAASYG